MPLLAPIMATTYYAQVEYVSHVYGGCEQLDLHVFLVAHCTHVALHDITQPI